MRPRPVTAAFAVRLCGLIHHEHAGDRYADLAREREQPRAQSRRHEAIEERHEPDRRDEGEQGVAGQKIAAPQSHHQGVARSSA